MINLYYNFLQMLHVKYYIAMYILLPYPNICIGLFVVVNTLFKYKVLVYALFYLFIFFKLRMLREHKRKTHALRAYWVNFFDKTGEKTRRALHVTYFMLQNNCMLHTVTVLKYKNTKRELCLNYLPSIDIS